MNDELMDRARELLALRDKATPGPWGRGIPMNPTDFAFASRAHDMADTIRDLMARCIAAAPPAQHAVVSPPAQGEAVCRTDGRCQYAIDHGAEGLGHCPKGKCAMPAVPDDVAYIAGALAMREKIARCIAMNPRRAIYEIAEHIRENIGPPSAEQAKQWDGDARAMLASAPEVPL